MFGNALTGEAQLKNVCFPKLVSLNSINFDYSECCFADKLMNCKDKKDGLSREGCGRVSLYKATGNPLCYTLECNYASGKLLNTISAKIVKSNGSVQPENDPITDINSSIYTEKQMATPAYTIEIFEDVGTAFCIALLDYVDKNPISRLPSSTFKTLDGLKATLVNQHKILIPKKPVLNIKSSHSFGNRNLQPLAKKPSSSQPRSHSLTTQAENKNSLAKKLNSAANPRVLIQKTNTIATASVLEPIDHTKKDDQREQQQFIVINEKTEESSQDNNTGSIDSGEGGLYNFSNFAKSSKQECTGNEDRIKVLLEPKVLEGTTGTIRNMSEQREKIDRALMRMRGQTHPL